EPGGSGFWAVTRYKDVWQVDRDFQTFSSEPTIMIRDPGPEEQQGLMGDYKMMLMMDPPQHTAYRRLIRNEFTVPVTAERIPRMQALARPSDDLATKLLQAEVDGRRLDDIEFLLFFLLLIDAGGDTTRNLLASGLVALHENPDQLAWLRADIPARLASAREELLRYTSPVVYM